MPQRTQGPGFVPPLRNLRAVMDAKGTTRAQVASRTGLSAPTLLRALRGAERVRGDTAEKISKAVGAPVESLFTDLTPEELTRAARLPAVTAGRGYSYLEAAAGRPDGRVGTPAEEEPASASAAASRRDRAGEREYVVLHRDQFEELRAAMATTNQRLETIEDALTEVASRPIAQFDVALVERPPGGRQDGQREGERP